MRRTGRVGPLRPGSSVCHSGGSGRASAIVNRGAPGAGDVCGRAVPPVAVAGELMVVVNNLAPQSKLRSRLATLGSSVTLRGCPLSRSCNSTRKLQRPWIFPHNNNPSADRLRLNPPPQHSRPRRICPRGSHRPQWQPPTRHSPSSRTAMSDSTASPSRLRKRASSGASSSTSSALVSSPHPPALLHS
jgi:hypothetical protein